MISTRYPHRTDTGLTWKQHRIDTELTWGRHLTDMIRHGMRRAQYILTGEETEAAWDRHGIDT